MNTRLGPVSGVGTFSSLLIQCLASCFNITAIAIMIASGDYRFDIRLYLHQKDPKTNAHGRTAR